MAKDNQRITRKFCVTVGDRSTVVRAETEKAAIEVAIPKLYGKYCFWNEDQGLPGYGQVFRPIPNETFSTSVTCRVRLVVTALAPKSAAFLAQEASDRAEAEHSAAVDDKAQKAYNEAWSAGVEGLPPPADKTLAKAYAEGAAVRQRELDHVAERKAKAEADESRRNQQAMQELLDAQNREAAYNAARAKIIAEAVAVELARLQTIDTSKPIEDPMLTALVRNVIACESFQNGISFGDWKKQLLAGLHPEIVSAYLTSPQILQKIANKLVNTGILDHLQRP